MPLGVETKIIISDTSCLIALTNIGLLDILRNLYEAVLVTPEVADEYGEPIPEWISIRSVKDTSKINNFNRVIGLGESSAIALALELDGVLLIVDDWEARQFAMNLGLNITGTLGILIRAYKQGFITDLPLIISRLRENGFHLPANIDELISS